MTLGVGSLLVLLSLAVLLGVHQGRERQAQRKALWAATASKLGGAFDCKGGAIRFSIRGRSTVISEDLEGSRPATMVRVDLKRRDIPEIGRRRTADSSGPGFELGPEAEHLFTAQQRASIRRALWQASVNSADLTAERLVLRRCSVDLAERDLLALTAAAAVLVEAVLEAGSVGQTLGRMEFRAFLGRCLVCGGSLQERVVACRRCRTPHHEECWRFARSCSLFGCRGARYTRCEFIESRN